MRMRGKKPIFNRKDTYSLYDTFNPILCEGLKRFKEVISNSEFAGVPNVFLQDNPILDSENIDVAFKEWLKEIDKMIYAFEDNEPDISEYNFEFVPNEDHHKEEILENGEKVYTWSMSPDNPEEYERCTKDEREHERKVQEGLESFGKYYRCLWY